MEAYASSSYTYCDAKVLSGFWRASIYESKLLIGRKIGWGDIAILNGMLATARDNAKRDPALRCTFAETDFTYEDAERLAAYWKTSTAEAKTRIELKILDGMEASLLGWLGKGNPH